MLKMLVLACLMLSSVPTKPIGSRAYDATLRIVAPLHEPRMRFTHLLHQPGAGSGVYAGIMLCDEENRNRAKPPTRQLQTPLTVYGHNDML